MVRVDNAGHFPGRIDISGDSQDEDNSKDITLEEGHGISDYVK